MWQILNDSVTLGFIGPLGTWEVLALAAIGLLIFGKRLPEVGKSLGRGIVEFKRGLTGIEDDLDQAAKQPPKIEKNESNTVDTPTGESTHPTDDPNSGQRPQHTT